MNTTNTLRAIDLATKHSSKNDSAKIGLQDALCALSPSVNPPFGWTNESHAIRCALRSLSHSVGILHPDYREVADMVIGLPDFNPSFDHVQ